MKKVWRIGGALVGIGALVGFVLSHLNANEYNDYVKPLRPHIAKQDALIEEMQKTTDAEALEKLPDYIERATALQKSFVDATPEDEELKEIHQHLVNRAESLLAYCTGMKVAYETKDQAKATAAMEHAKAAKAHLDAFVAARNAYGKKYDIKFDDE